jgi:hypothetical protein
VKTRRVASDQRLTVRLMTEDLICLSELVIVGAADGL